MPGYEVTSIMFYVIGLIRPRFKRVRSEFHDLLNGGKWELIQPFRLVGRLWMISNMLFPLHEFIRGQF